MIFALLDVFDSLHKEVEETKFPENRIIWLVDIGL